MAVREATTNGCPERFPGTNSLPHQVTSEMNGRAQVPAPGQDFGPVTNNKHGAAGATETQSPGGGRQEVAPVLSRGHDGVPEMSAPGVLSSPGPEDQKWELPEHPSASEGTGKPSPHPGTGKPSSLGSQAPVSQSQAAAGRGRWVLWDRIRHAASFQVQDRSRGQRMAWHRAVDSSCVLAAHKGQQQGFRMPST